jgi:hypothetical protein
MGIFNATSTYGRGFKPTQVADQFLVRVYTGGVAGQREADAGVEKEAHAFLSKEGYGSYGIVARRRSFMPSYFEYTIQFSRGSAAPTQVAAPAGWPQPAGPVQIPAPGTWAGWNALASAAAPASALASAAPAWMPTHIVPAGGVAFWDAPEPSRPPLGRLSDGVELVVDSSVGAWAQVRGENGWRGWVDGRLLVVRS